MKHLITLPAALVLGVILIALPAGTNAQFGKLKNKLKDKVSEKITETKSPKDSTSNDTSETSSSPQTDSTGLTSSTDTATAKDNFSLYTKFDFVPGNNVLYYDDLAGEEVGEFPSRWNLVEGVFEIAKVGPEPWIMVSTQGTISPKLNGPLPDKYTVEFEFLNRTKSYQGSHFIEFEWVDAEENIPARLQIWNNHRATFYMNDGNSGDKVISEIAVQEAWASGIHSLRMMVTKSSIKCYIDEQRVVNVPKTEGFAPTGFRIAFMANDDDFAVEKMFVRNFRLAQGGKTLKEQLDETGKIVTHGIYFDSGSDQIKGESYKTLADIGQLLTENPALKISIEGHTDSDGADNANLDLSQRRAEAVRTYLIATFKIDAARLEAKGWGETKPIDVNTSAEGKANNRRVELVKLG